MTKLDKLREDLRGIYDDELSEEDLNAYAEDIYQTYFVQCRSLDGIFGTVFENESDCGIDEEDSQVSYVYSEIIRALDNGENTARRLYDTFMHHYEDLDVVIKLVNSNAKWLTNAELNAVKKKAWEVFDKDMLRSLGYDWENI